MPQRQSRKRSEMTIAACYLSSEGIVFGADSTSTIWIPGPGGDTGALHHLNYSQKVFEIGTESTLGIVMWGMGAINDLAHRTLIARFADDLKSNPTSSMLETAERFCIHFWDEYKSRLSDPIKQFQEIDSKKGSGITEEQTTIHESLQQALSGGYCLGGYLPSNRIPQAFEILYHPSLQITPVPNVLKQGSAFFWGCPNIIDRVLYAQDESLFNEIKESEYWTGSEEDLFELIRKHRFAQPYDLPLREAIDWTHTIIYATIKAMKFSHLPPVCGGPIEISVISTDRLYRWVKHKRFHAALSQH